MSGALGERLSAVRAQVGEACRSAGRDPSGVTLVAVSKRIAAARILGAYEAGQRVFGESRQQEASPKVAELPDDIDWHFIGKVQRNKVRKILPEFGTLHGIGALKLAQAVDRVAGELALRPACFLEVNLGGEESKGGFRADDLLAAGNQLAGLDHVDFRGVMVIPPQEEDAGRTRRWFSRARELRDQLAASSGMALPDLSMGMSGDFELAILEGATVVRVGTAIFGERPD